MKYSKARELFFQYFLIEKEIDILDRGINMYKRNMPHDNGPSSLHIMGLMDIEVDKKTEKEKERDDIKDEIDLILRIFK